METKKPKAQKSVSQNETLNFKIINIFQKQFKLKLKQNNQKKVNLMFKIINIEITVKIQKQDTCCIY